MGYMWIPEIKMKIFPMALQRFFLMFFVFVFFFNKRMK